MTSQELISKHIQNKLTQEEQIEFDSRFENDEDFKKELAFHENLKKVTIQKDDENFREFLSHLESTNSDRDIEKNNLQKWLYIAASIIVLIGVTYLFTIDRTYSNEELFSIYFEPYRNITQPVVRSEGSDTATKTAFNAYENDDFKESLDLFDVVLKERPNDTIAFYKAIALLKLNDAKKAIPLLKKNIHVSNSFSEKKYWYLALSYLKINELEKSKENLQLLIEVPDSNYKKEEGKELLKKLQQLSSENHDTTPQS